MDAYSRMTIIHKEFGEGDYSQHSSDQDSCGTPRNFCQIKMIKELNSIHKGFNKMKKQKRKSKCESIYSSQSSIAGLPSLRDASKIPPYQDIEWKVAHDTKYKGKMAVDGVFDGPVQIMRRDGTYYKGQYKRGIPTNGYIKFPNGFHYKGTFSDCQFRGFGILTFPNGKIVTGQWNQGYVQQNARIDYPTGQVYYGQLKKLKKHGEGHLFFKEGKKYSGEFVYGKITGFGQYLVDEQVIVKGKWENGVLIEQFDVKTAKYIQATSRPNLPISSKTIDDEDQLLY